MNTRANIMYFIEHFLDLAQRDGHSDYIRMMQRDIIRVVDAVAPDDGSGAANVKVVRKVCSGAVSLFSLVKLTDATSAGFDRASE
jgi:CTD kinase subunit gamma